LRRSGLEFTSPKPLPLWSECRLTLRNCEGEELQANAVVVACRAHSDGQFRLVLLFLHFICRAQEIQWLAA